MSEIGACSTRSSPGGTAASRLAELVEALDGVVASHPRAVKVKAVCGRYTAAVGLGGRGLPPAEAVAGAAELA